MLVLSSPTNRWVLRWSSLVVRSGNQRSIKRDKVQPGAGGGGGREVQVKPRVSGEPPVDRRGLTGGGVIQDRVHVEMGRDLAVDGSQELAELDGAGVRMQRADDLAACDAQGRIQAGGPARL